MEWRGPGFNRSVARAVQSARPGARLVFCESRRYWLVVERAPARDVCWWSGVHRTGWSIVLHWCGVGGVYGARTADGRRGGFLPPDLRLLDVLRAGDPGRQRVSHEEQMRKLEAEDERLKRLSNERAKAETTRRIMDSRAIPEFSIPGVSPGNANPRRRAERDFKERLRAGA